MNKNTKNVILTFVGTLTALAAITFFEDRAMSKANARAKKHADNKARYENMPYRNEVLTDEVVDVRFAILMAMAGYKKA